ncbi:hypothetical protein [Mesorhizobium sp. SP-1A]|uniref:hypothetical protein n=1 Tax=Mesorhizobium sp. SP-1A TaxID=3077840 RepID=UPI0028F6C3A4|nr:hypothetical protein [Mesorhizobium sp. SP-1A]
MAVPPQHHRHALVSHFRVELQISGLQGGSPVGVAAGSAERGGHDGEVGRPGYFGERARRKVERFLPFDLADIGGQKITIACPPHAI